MENTIELAEVIQELRSELQRTMKAGEGEGLRFEVQDLELELQVGVTKSITGGGEGSAKVTFLVFEIGASGKAEGSWSTERTQKLKLKLKPIPAENVVDDNGVFLSGD